jgi:hypothetical protein
MKAGHVVYVDSNPQNIVGIFFDQAFPSGKTSEQAANDFSAALPVTSDVRRAEIDDYQLLSSLDVNV